MLLGSPSTTNTKPTPPTHIRSILTSTHNAFRNSQPAPAPLHLDQRITWPRRQRCLYTQGIHLSRTAAFHCLRRDRRAAAQPNRLLLSQHTKGEGGRVNASKGCVHDAEIICAARRADEHHLLTCALIWALSFFLFLLLSSKSLFIWHLASAVLGSASGSFFFSI